MSYTVNIYVNDPRLANSCLDRQELEFLPAGTTEADIEAMRRDGCVAWTSVLDDVGRAIGHAFFDASASGAMDSDGTGCLRIDSLPRFDAALESIEGFLAEPPDDLYINDVPPRFPATERLMMQLGTLRSLLISGEGGIMRYEGATGDWNVALVTEINKY